MAAEDMRRLIREVRISRPEIVQNKNEVKNLIHKYYGHIFDENRGNAEVYRYNFWLWQMEQMRKADFVRIDDSKKSVDLSKLKGFSPAEKNKQFSPILVTPNLNIEISSFSETVAQLMDLPDIMEFSNEFLELTSTIYIAQGYSFETTINNMIIQMLLMNGYILTDDITRGTVVEKVNRETFAAAKYAALKILKNTSKK